MLKKSLIFYFILMLLSFFYCSNAPHQTVVIKPQKPLSGDKIKIIFTPKTLIGDEVKAITLIGQVFSSRDEKKDVFELMKKRGNSWIAELVTEKNNTLISLKFEDNLGRCEDNWQIGWNFLLYDENGKPKKNSQLMLGKLFLGELHEIAKTDFMRAKQQFLDELKNYPDNLEAKFQLWRTQLALSGNPDRLKSKIRDELDSLKGTGPDKVQLAKLEFETCFRLMNDISCAFSAGEKVLNSSDHSRSAEEIRYAMAFLRGNGKRQLILDNLEKFAVSSYSKELKKIALLRLAEEYQKSQNKDKAIELYQEYLKIFPDDVPIILTLASLRLKKGELAETQKLIEEAKKANSFIETYLRKNLWKRPAEREAEKNLDLCHIYSTEAELEYARGNFSGAIDYRIKSIKNGTLFPAFEWEKVGDIYREIGVRDSALAAYCRAVVVNKFQKSAVEKIKNLYLSMGGKVDSFDSFFAEQVRIQQKAMAMKAPDCKLEAMDGGEMSLSRLSGKVILVTFFDVWSEASKQQIKLLNQLYEKFSNHNDIKFLAISIEAPLTVKHYLKENPISFDIFHSGYQAKKKFGVIGFPSHFIIDKQGKIRFKHFGYMNDMQTLKTELESLLKEAKTIAFTNRAERNPG